MFWVKNKSNEPCEIVSISDVPGHSNYRNITYKIKFNTYESLGPLISRRIKIELEQEIVGVEEIFEAKNFVEALKINNNWNETDIKKYFDKQMQELEETRKRDQTHIEQYFANVKAIKKLDEPKSFWKSFFG